MENDRQKYFAVMDESISHKGGKATYVISASIFREPKFRIDELFINFLVGAKIFKTNRFYARKRFGRIKSALLWNRDNFAFNICSADTSTDMNFESARQFCLAKVLVALNGLEVSRCIMDSRENPDANDSMAPNREDLLTLKLLKEDFLVASELVLVHLTDHQCPLIGTADVVSWSARRFIIGEDDAYWRIISNNSIIV